jgi:uncharacterized membrane protein HdeD (DUF308 family)
MGGMTKIFDMDPVSKILYIASKKPDNEEPSISTSFEEKSVWMQLASLGVVLIAYGAVAGSMLVAGVKHIVPYVPVFAVAVVLLIILMIVGNAIAAIAGRPEGLDERDRLIVWRAESNAGWVLSLGVFAALAGLIMSINNVWIAHVLLLSMFLSEMAKLVFHIIYYRQGM